MAPPLLRMRRRSAAKNWKSVASRRRSAAALASAADGGFVGACPFRKTGSHFSGACAAGSCAFAGGPAGSCSAASSGAGSCAPCAPSGSRAAPAPAPAPAPFWREARIRALGLGVERDAELEHDQRLVLAAQDAAALDLPDQRLRGAHPAAELSLADAAGEAGGTEARAALDRILGVIGNWRINHDRCSCRVAWCEDKVHVPGAAQQRRRLSALVRCRHRSRVHPRSALDTAQVGQGRLGWTVTVRGGPGSAVHRHSASKTRVNALTASASRCTASGTRARVKVSLPRGPGAQWRGPQPSTRVRRPGMTAEMQGRENEVSDCANQKTRTAGPAGAKRPIAFRQ